MAENQKSRNSKRKNNSSKSSSSWNKKSKVENSQISVQNEPSAVVFSRSDSAPQLLIAKDQLTVTGEKGYRMARASMGVSEGCFFWECEILKPEKPEAHCRLGWAQQQAPLQAPVGYDKWSFGYRDIAGSKVHQSLRHDNYGEEYGYSEEIEHGDIVGFLIYLPPRPKAEADELSPSANESSDSTNTVPNMPSTSHIRFYKNGIDQGIAYENIPEGTYYPAVSLYSGAKVRANFGPQFIYKPKFHLKTQPMRSMKKEEVDEKQAQLKWIYQRRQVHGIISQQQLETKLQGMIKQRNQPTRSKK
mmetsp:Transcript_16931/g.22384  ORF Transcript_16931/g.22384 Transcript_16931/m.22384 type:complete len:303 (+) Transcript_16931:76-984(+)